MRTVSRDPAHPAPFARVVLLSLLTSGALLAPAPVAAQPSPILSRAAAFDPSIQTAAMGGASVAVFWLEEPNEWGNPATLGFVRGVRYVHGEMHRDAPSPEQEVELRSDRLLAGISGIGVSLAGKPIESLGGLRLDYAPQTVSDGFGGFVVVRPYEEVRSFSVGVSVLDVLSNLGSIGFRDRISLSVGHTWKDLIAHGLDPGGVEPSTESGESMDRGALVRVVPIDGIGTSLLAPRDAMGVRLELGGGYTERNYGEPSSQDVVRVLERETLRGASGRLTTALPTGIGRGWFWDFATPTISFAFTYERTKGESPGANGEDYDLVRSGGEISILDMIALRLGRVDDEEGGVEGNTWGAGISLQYRKAVGVRFDWARVPGEAEASELDRYAVTLFIEPLRFDASGGLE
ncbi:MAG TPA: hypothetical protein VFP58_12445 [Candidatus Eisenbacteria bacterium]|nr:hypothetical protein [Candidatus Eisenbacteria bacterium]